MPHAYTLKYIFKLKHETKESSQQKKCKWLRSIAKYLDNREMQMKSTLGFHLRPVRTAKIKTANDDKCWCGCRKEGNLFTVCGSGNWFSHYGNQNEFPKKLEIDLPYDTDIPLPCMCPKDSTLLHRHFLIHVYCYSTSNI
jgi:hypothetical protein